MRTVASLGFVIVYLMALAPTVYAHTGQPLAPHDLWSSWSWEPLLLVGLALSGCFYAWAVRTLWRSAGRGRGVGHSQVVAFSVGLTILFVALVSPLAALSDSLFAAHMVQHVLLMNVAAPLLIWGGHPALLMWGLPQPSRRNLARWWLRQPMLRAGWCWICRPAVLWSLYGGTLWLWHVPRFYQAALASETVHHWEHASFVGSALLFWWLLRRQDGHRGLNDGAAMLLLFTTALHSGLLAALITFASKPLYPFYATTVYVWGVTPLADQQLAGVVMWVPVGFLYLGAVLWRLGTYLRHAERTDRAKHYTRHGHRMSQTIPD